MAYHTRLHITPTYGKNTNILFKIQPNCNTIFGKTTTIKLCKPPNLQVHINLTKEYKQTTDSDSYTDAGYV